jgi:ABC-2 type transport system permease protein
MKDLLLPAYSLWKREVVRFLRQPSRVIVAVLTPLLFWLFLGVGIGANFQPQGAPAGVTYLEYFFPGSMVLVILFTGIFSTITLIQDRQAGFLQGVLVAPIPRASIALGKIAGGTTLALIQACLFLVVGSLAGIPVTAGNFPLLLLSLTIVGFGLTGMGFAIAWPMESIQGFHGVMNLIIMPMWLLSGAFFPIPQNYGVLGILMRLNPLSYGLAATRHTLGGPGAELPGLPSLEACLMVAMSFGILTLVVSTVLVRRESRS